MEPFIHLVEFPFVICKECQFGCVADEVVTHLRERHGHIKSEIRKEISISVKAIPGIVQKRAELVEFATPRPETAPIPYIEAPRTDGLSCRECRYISRQLQKIQQHCRDHHGWKNPRKRGRSTAIASEALPWVEGVCCQRFFASRQASGWFEVGRGSQGPEESAEGGETVEQRIKRIHQQQVARFEAKKRQIEAPDEKKEPNAWLRRVGWAEHLQGFDRERLRASVRPIQEDEVVLRQVWDSCERVMEQAKAATVPQRVGHAALFEINRKEVHVKAKKPFDSRMEDDTWARYKEVMRKLVCYAFRTEEWEEERPSYELTDRQESLLDRVTIAAKDAVQGDSQDQARHAAIDRMCLDMMVELFDHALKDTHYESVVISGLAVMGIREDGGWATAEDYTPVYSAIIKSVRMLVVYQAVTERDEQVASKERIMSRKEARRAVAGIFRLVRAKVQRFMILVSSKSEPSPIDWIFDTRTYGLKIRYTTAAAGSIDWQGEQVTYQRIKMTMSQLAEMLHGLVGETKTQLGRLLMAEDMEPERWPAIPWTAIEDDHSEDRVGYSFLSDDRNTWIGRGNGWIVRQMVRRPEKQAEWLSSDTTSANPYKPTAVRQYKQLFEAFRERLLIAIYIIAGQPARAPEVIGIRHTNTANGGIRNIFAHHGMICFVTVYHKNYQSSEQVKIIHRYLPREVGKLLVWYLWLILPFWQEVVGIATGGDDISAFMWDDEIVKKEESPEAGEEEEAGDEEEAEREEAEREEIEAERGSEASEQDGEEEKRFQQWVTAPKWTSDRMRRIMQQHSARFVGHRIGISAWRQIAVGIANRYLNRAFRQSGEGLGEEDEDDDGVEDSAWDLQAGHGTHVAGLVYARELQQGQFGTAARRDKFQAVSRQWHRFLGFGADDESRHWQQAKRKKSVFEGMREEARFRRFARLQHVDIEGQLRQMVGSEARFRGIQKEVIQAVIRGESPIVQITGTGGGKSMSFMLPAYCSPEGVTIVVVPLVALREDLHRRCQDSRIESHVWQGREANRAATVVFVTPESAVTKGFQLFVNRLQARQQLDRIVVDECHTVLDSDRSFRPQMKEVGGMIRESGVQAVFLTATLAPQDEDEFYHRIGLSPSRVRMFRARTTRGNIRYKVVTVDDKEAREAAVERAVTDGLRHYETGKVIVYSGLVEQAERLGTLLSCPVYHSKVDTAAGKARRMKEWLEETRVIVATNALGLGIDIPDVRLVVHAGVPRRLRDYAQESGRGGRDGSESEAVVIRVQGEAEMKEEETKEVYDQGIQEFAAGWVCRRVVLDRVMDGWHERIGCEQGEAPCDICERVGVQEEEEDIQEQDVESAEVRVQATAFLRCRSSQVREGEARRREVQREAEEVEGFRQMVESWVDCCVVCRLAGQENVYHAAEHCPEQESEVWEDIRDGVALMEQELFTKRQMEKFAGCFDCGMPQAMCGRWVVVDDDGGRFERVGQGRCQYEGLLIRLYVGFMVCYGGDGLGLVEKVAREEGFSGEPGQWYKWFGKRIIWGGIESSRLCRICYRLGQLEGGNR